MDFSRISQEEREKLYNEVWSEPMTIVAPRYNLSDNGLRKHCIRLWIPLPPAGYWAKIRSGQKIPRPILPEVRGELKRYVYNYAIKYKKNIENLSDKELKSSGDLSLLTDDTIALINEACSNIQAKGQLRNPHKLIDEHMQETEYRKKRDKALQRSNFNTHYYDITKSKYRENKAILPINVSEANMNRAYRVLDTLINTIDKLEGFTHLSCSDGKDCAYFSVMHAYFYFEMKECERKKSKDASNTEIPKLLFFLRSEDFYYNDIKNSVEFMDETDKPLEEQIGKILYWIFKTANSIQIDEILKEREEKREQEERIRQQRLEKMRKGELAEIKLLNQAAADWEQAQRIRSFIDEVERKISDMEDHLKEKIAEWIKWARDKADWLDPLTEKEDELLGKSKQLFGQILEE